VTIKYKKTLAESEATRYKLHALSSFPNGGRNVSFRHNMYTGSGDHSALYPVDTVVRVNQIFSYVYYSLNIN